jgi:heme-degrading monooxygenase HmoA
LFERTYGPEGEWVQLFRRDAKYRGTRLLRDAKHERVYVTMDLWDSQEAYQEFRAKYAKDYAEIDRKCEGLTVTESRLAEFGR